MTYEYIQPEVKRRKNDATVKTAAANEACIG